MLLLLFAIVLFSFFLSSSGCCATPSYFNVKILLSFFKDHLDFRVCLFQLFFDYTSRLLIQLKISQSLFQPVQGIFRINICIRYIILSLLSVGPM